ncbi:hypothetical protein GCM10009552_09100 [Rothia nasimurium]
MANPCIERWVWMKAVTIHFPDTLAGKKEGPSVRHGKRSHDIGGLIQPVVPGAPKYKWHVPEALHDAGGRLLRDVASSKVDGGTHKAFAQHALTVHLMDVGLPGKAAQMKRYRTIEQHSCCRVGMCGGIPGRYPSPTPLCIKIKGRLAEHGTQCIDIIDGLRGPKERCIGAT